MYRMFMLFVVKVKLINWGTAKKITWFLAVLSSKLEEPDAAFSVVIKYVAEVIKALE